MLFLLLWGMAGTAAADDEILPAPSQEMPLGEKLVYKITWLRIPVGHGQIEVVEKTTLKGRDVYVVEGQVQTNAVLSKIFPMKDIAKSWIDAETQASVQFEKKVDELLLHQHERVVFDAAKAQGYYESFRTGEKKEFDIKTPPHDVVSAFYWARRQPLQVGESAQTVLSADQADWELTVTARKIEELEIHDRKIKTIRIDPNTRIGDTEKKGRAWFHVTADAARIPVRIVYKAPFGKVVGTLVESKEPSSAPQ